MQTYKVSAAVLGFAIVWESAIKDGAPKNCLDAIYELDYVRASELLRESNIASPTTDYILCSLRWNDIGEAIRFGKRVSEKWRLINNAYPGRAEGEEWIKMRLPFPPPHPEGIEVVEGYEGIRQLKKKNGFTTYYSVVSNPENRVSVQKFEI